MKRPKVKLTKGSYFRNLDDGNKYHVMEVFEDEPTCQYAVKYYSKYKKRWTYQIKSQIEIDMFFEAKIFYMKEIIK